MHIDHVAIAVRDAERSARWYRESLSMEPVHDEVVIAAGVRLLYLAVARSGVGSTMIQLAEPIGAGPVDTFVRDHGEGLHHVCFAVDDLLATLGSLGEDESGVFRGGRDRRACFLRHRPNDTLIELTDVRPVYSPAT